MRCALLAGVSAGCALGGLLAGCGGEQAATPGAHVPAAVAPVRTASVRSRPTKGSALAFARAVNLRAADVPGAKISRKKEKHPGEGRELDRCEGHSRPQQKLIDLESPKLTRGEELETEQIRSDVTVVADGRAASRAVALLASRAVRECAARALTRRFARQTVKGASWGRFSVTPLSVSAPGADGAVGLRVSTTLNVPVSEVTVPLYVDIMGFAMGPAEVAMSATSITQPVPAAAEHQLLALLLSRAKAHAL